MVHVEINILIGIHFPVAKRIHYVHQNIRSLCSHSSFWIEFFFIISTTIDYAKQTSRALLFFRKKFSNWKRQTKVINVTWIMQTDANYLKSYFEFSLSAKIPFQIPFSTQNELLDTYVKRIILLFRLEWLMHFSCSDFFEALPSK